MPSLHTPPLTTLAVAPDGAPIVSTLMKRTYDVSPAGTCSPSEEQLPLELDAPPDASWKGTWEDELDLWPYKLATDVVVFGSAHAPERGCTRMEVSVEVGRVARKRIAVLGDRECHQRPDGTLRIAEPAPFETIPVAYDRAYGGVDATVAYPREPQSLGDAMAMSLPAGQYPRNPVGKGYVVARRPETLEGLALPNLEDPEDLLDADRLIVRSPELWHRQPLPQSFGWLDPGWFPRCALAGGLPFYEPDENVSEVALGYLASDYRRRIETAELDELISFRLPSGASPGLTVPYLRGDETLRVTGMTPEGDWRISLPADLPRPAISWRGQPLDLELAIHTVCLLVEERRLFVVWRASARLPATFRPRLRSVAQPDADPLEDFDVSCRW